MSYTSSKLVFGSIVVGACAIACLAIVAQGQYNNYDSDSNSELGKLVRNSGRIQAQNQRLNQQAAAAVAAATRNLHSQQQPMQYAPTQHNRRNYGSSSDSALNSGYAPFTGATARGSHSNSDLNDDDEGSNFGPNFNANLDGQNDDEGSNLNGDGKVTNLNQAASGYPNQGDYNNDGAGASGFNFDGASGFGPSSAEGSDFGPSEEFSSEGRRAKSASSPMSSRNYGSSEDDTGAPQYGPNSAINADGEEVVDGRANYAPQQDNDNDNDDE